MMTMASCMRAFPWLVAGFAGAVLGTSAAFAQCEQSVVAHPGVPVQIGTPSPL